jgi:hypothetical protein
MTSSRRLFRGSAVAVSVALSVAAFAAASAQPASAHRARQAATYTPDLVIGTFGDGVYSSDGSGETKTVKVTAGKAVTVTFALQNDGDTTDSYDVAGTAGAKPFTVSYFNPGGYSITTTMEQGTYDPGLVTFGTSFGGLKLKIKAAKSAKPGKKGSILMTAHSHSDSGEVDVLKIVPVVK